MNAGLSLRVVGALLAGVAAGGCAALVDFPDRTTEDGGEVADATAPDDAGGDGHAPDATVGDASGDSSADAGDASAAPDVGTFCSTVDAQFCDDFEGPSLDARGWKPVNTVDGGSASVVALEGGVAGNHGLAIFLPDSASSGDVDEQQPHTAVDGGSGVLRVAFDLMMSSSLPASQFIYLAQIDQNNHSVLLYAYTATNASADDVKLAIQERRDDNSTDDLFSLDDVDATGWRRVEIDLRPMGTSSTVSATLDGTALGPGEASLASDWTTQQVNFRLGNSYIQGSGAKTLLYDDVVTDSR